MKGCILFASPRKNSNTKQIVDIFIDESKNKNIKLDFINLYDKKIEPCIACRKCQETWTEFGCWYKDDVQEIFDKVMESELIVIATPIHSWYCTAPMKALLDRLVYGMDKYYGEEKGPSLWKGKKVILISTCGYPPAKGADLFLDGLKRYCKHSGLEFLGEHIVHDLGYKVHFMNEDREEKARWFGRNILALLNDL